MMVSNNDSNLFENDDATVPKDNVVDEAETEQQPHTRFQITSYGADMTVFELTHRLGKELIIPPAFQRKYVWSKRQASRFIESLLMGLPVPGIFLFKDQKLKKQLLVDGLQRLQGIQPLVQFAPFSKPLITIGNSGSTLFQIIKFEQISVRSYPTEMK